MEEYRFQVTLNWTRTQQWFALDTAITAASVALLHVADNPATYVFVAGVFLGGALVAAFAIYGIESQHEYYRAIRDHKANLEKLMGLGPLAIRTTVGMGGTKVRRFKVKDLIRTLLVLLALLNVGGATYALWEAVDKGDDPHPVRMPTTTTGSAGKALIS